MHAARPPFPKLWLAMTLHWASLVIDVSCYVDVSAYCTNHECLFQLVGNLFGILDFNRLDHFEKELLSNLGNLMPPDVGQKLKE